MLTDVFYREAGNLQVRVEAASPLAEGGLFVRCSQTGLNHKEMQTFRNKHKRTPHKKKGK